MRFLPVFLLPLIVLTACGPDVLYEEEVELPGQTWTYDQPVEFHFEVEDTNTRYDLVLELKHGTDYPWQNLYTLITTRFPNGDSVQQQLSLELMDKVGYWQGRCNAEDCIIEIPLQESAYFQESGSYQLRLEQHMRRDSIPGLMQLGLKVVASD